VPTYRSISTGKKHELIKGRTFGHGAYGDVGTITDRPDFVYKEVLLDPKEGDWVALSREARIKAIYRELWALKKLNLLEGYIRENDRIILIMPKALGTMEAKANLDPNFDPQNYQSMLKTAEGVVLDEDKAVAAFRALLELNRKGVNHCDANFENCLVHRDDNGKLQATWIDFGNARGISGLANNAQWRMFDGCRPITSDSYKQKLAAAKAEFASAHRREDLFYLGLQIVAGVALMSVCGFNSYFAWQLFRSSLMQTVLNEIRFVLDQFDMLYTFKLNSNEFTPAQLYTEKALISLGYLLLNIYTLYNLLNAIPSSKVLGNLKELVLHLRQLNPTSVTEATSNVINHAILPLIRNTIEILKSPSNYGHIIDRTVLDKGLAEITYLYKQVKMTATHLASTFEKVPPAEQLLWRSDLMYRYNPMLLATYAKTKVKEFVFGQEPDDSPSRSPRGPQWV
jgi:hypothetical protein